MTDFGSLPTLHAKRHNGHAVQMSATRSLIKSPRQEQVTVFRLRTGHNPLNYHLYSKLRTGHTEQCPCGTGSQTTEHLLQSCPIYEPLKGNVARPHSHSLQAVQKPEGLAMHCHLHRGDWSFHLTKEKKKKKKKSPHHKRD